MKCSPDVAGGPSRCMAARNSKSQAAILVCGKPPAARRWSSRGTAHVAQNFPAVGSTLRPGHIVETAPRMTPAAGLQLTAHWRFMVGQVHVVVVPNGDRVDAAAGRRPYRCRRRPACAHVSGIDGNRSRYESTGQLCPTFSGPYWPASSQISSRRRSAGYPAAQSRPVRWPPAGDGRRWRRGKECSLGRCFAGQGRGPGPRFPLPRVLVTEPFARKDYQMHALRPAEGRAAATGVWARGPTFLNSNPNLRPPDRLVDEARKRIDRVELERQAAGDRPPGGAANLSVHFQASEPCRSQSTISSRWAQPTGPQTSIGSDRALQPQLACIWIATSRPTVCSSASSWASVGSSAPASGSTLRPARPP